MRKRVTQSEQKRYNSDRFEKSTRSDKVKVTEDRHNLPTMPWHHLGRVHGCMLCTLTFNFAVIFKCGMFNKAWKITKQGHVID